MNIKRNNVANIIFSQLFSLFFINGIAANESDYNQRFLLAPPLPEMPNIDLDSTPRKLKVENSKQEENGKIKDNNLINEQMLQKIYQEAIDNRNNYKDWHRYHPSLFKDFIGYLRKAKEGFFQVAQNGNVRAMHNYAMLAYKYDKLEAAHYWFRRAAERGFEPSKRNLVRLNKRLNLQHEKSQIISLELFLESLPSELFVHVLSFLPPTDIALSIRLASKQFHSLSYDKALGFANNEERRWEQIVRAPSLAHVKRLIVCTVNGRNLYQQTFEKCGYSKEGSDRILRAPYGEEKIFLSPPVAFKFLGILPGALFYTISYERLALKLPYDLATDIEVYDKVRQFAEDVYLSPEFPFKEYKVNNPKFDILIHRKDFNTILDYKKRSIVAGYICALNNIRGMRNCLDYYKLYEQLYKNIIATINTYLKEQDVWAALGNLPTIQKEQWTNEDYRTDIINSRKIFLATTQFDRYALNLWMSFKAFYELRFPIHILSLDLKRIKLLFKRITSILIIANHEEANEWNILYNKHKYLEGEELPYKGWLLAAS
ncbi:F-box protein [Candidatus Odyssella thessalonicensis]|uniref:F-box protein n=1 Tax=Candidatus Odyssella thessalonicensis TaxID=84647 RepID=UPI000225B75E|nr:F-box protein [Candidatus Odyssella thessalonicensis]